MFHFQCGSLKPRYFSVYRYIALLIRMWNRTRSPFLEITFDKPWTSILLSPCWNRDNMAKKNSYYTSTFSNQYIVTTPDPTGKYYVCLQSPKNFRHLEIRHVILSAAKDLTRRTPRSFAALRMTCRTPLEAAHGKSSLQMSKKIWRMPVRRL